MTVDSVRPSSFVPAQSTVTELVLTPGGGAGDMSKRLRRLMGHRVDVGPRARAPMLAKAVLEASATRTSFTQELRSIEVDGSTCLKNGRLEIAIDYVQTPGVAMRETAKHLNLGLALCMSTIASAVLKRLERDSGAIHEVKIVAGNVVNESLREMLASLGLQSHNSPRTLAPPVAVGAVFATALLGATAMLLTGQTLPPVAALPCIAALVTGPAFMLRTVQDSRANRRNLSLVLIARHAAAIAVQDLPAGKPAR